jgi:HlyD family type I secretion membrane fusion protein
MTQSPFDKKRKRGAAGNTGSSENRQLPSVYRSLAPKPINTTHAVIRGMRQVTALTDRLGQPLESTVLPQDAASPDVLAARATHVGVTLAILLFGVFGLWAALWPLATGAVATGKVVLDSSRKTIQHLEGGIVKEILVKEGQKVTAGDVLVRLDATTANSKRDVQRSQYIAVRAGEARLIAERDGLDAITFPQELMALEGKDAEVTEQMDTQRRLFATRKANLKEQMDALQQRINQGQEEIGGLRQQVSAAGEQLRLLNEEIAMVQSLVNSGNAVRSRLLALQRSAAQIGGMRGEAMASIGRANQQINESRVNLANKKTEYMNQVINDLRDAQVQSANLGEQLRSAQAIAQRIDITAPLSGQVVGLNIHTVGGVIAPGEKLMDIVPTGDKLVIEAMVNPQDIDQVHVGLKSRVRLTAYKQRKIHPVEGTVTTVSADRFDEPENNRSFYKARIEIPAEEMADMKNVELTPGMPAEVLIVTGSRTMLSYLLDPIRYGFGRAFREE